MNKKIASSIRRSQPITPINYNLLDQLKAAVESAASKPAQRSGNGYRLQCTAHGGMGLDLYISDGYARAISRGEYTSIVKV